ncbi:hypothetical protein MHYP_G00184120 [Metynnis hypsauchen]
MDSLGTVLTPSDSYAGLETVETNSTWSVSAAEYKQSLRAPEVPGGPNTASNSNRSTPTCSPVLRKRSRSPTPQSPEGENMVEKGSDHSSDKSPSTPEQAVQRTYSQSVHTSTRSGGKNSKGGARPLRPFQKPIKRKRFLSKRFS